MWGGDQEVGEAERLGRGGAICRPWRMNRLSLDRTRRGGGRSLKQHFPNQVHRTPISVGILWFPLFLTHRSPISFRL